MAAQQSPLRRWKRLFPVFNTIDAAIVASVPAGQISDEVMVLRQATRDVVQDLCDAPEDDAAEDLCRLLDDVMVEYLITLKGVVTVTTPSLGKALGALEDLHESKRVRELARFVRISIAKARTRIEIEKPDEREKRVQVKDAPSRTTRRVEGPSPAREVPAWLPKKGAPGGGGARRASTAANNIDKSSKPLTKTPGRAGMNRMMTESAKRKPLEGYQEAADAKRRRKIQVIYPPNEMVEQRRRKRMHPVLTERSRGSSGVSNTAVRRF